MKEKEKIVHIRHRKPFMIPAIVFLTGIAAAQIAKNTFDSLLAYLPATCLICALLCIGCYLLFLQLPRYATIRFGRVHYVLALCALFFTGAWNLLYQNEYKITAHTDTLTALYAKVERISPTKNGKYVRISCKTIAFTHHQKTLPCKQPIFIYLPVQQYDTTLQAGSHIFTAVQVDPLAKPPTAFITRSTCFAHTPSPPSFFATLNQKLRTHLKENIRNPRSYALLSGLSIGNKDDFDAELKSAYSSSGAMHVLAVSGLHVGIIYAFLRFFFDLLIPGNNRKRHIFKQLLILTGLASFAAIAGFSASVTRALLMTVLLTFGRIIRRPIHTHQTLFATALLICAVNPLALFEVGFQLSFSAVFAIITLQPVIQNVFKPKNKPLRYIWSLSTVSVAAQAGTFPLTLYYFGSFPYLFLLTNLWVIPLTGILICLLCIWLLLGQIPYIGPALLWLLAQLAQIMNQGVLLLA